MNEELLEKFRHEEECFVLIANIRAEELDGIEVLRQYKQLQANACIFLGPLVCPSTEEK